MKNVITIIPIYRNEVTPNEDLYILNNIDKLINDSDLSFICPVGIDKTNYLKYNIPFIELDINFFKNTKTYNKLMLTDKFYGLFIKYKYMLICHTDAYIFKPELSKWVDMDYDYIGAPWLNVDWLGFKSGVGNGGLSLRKCEFYYNFLKNNKNYYTGLKLNEDFLLSEYLKMKNEKINLCPVEKAVFFAWESEIDKCKKLTNGELPFGIHKIK